ncbi:MAG: siphovirus Gp157 family protein [Rubricoccaceae bacterium]|nr:siphovirus Gp157 family protein [Rubricoccaceae bacterium]
MISPLTLYELDDELLHLEAELLEAGGAVDEATDARHTALLDARDDKVEAYCMMIRRFEATAEAVKAERQRLQDAERALATAAKRLKDRLCDSMRARGEHECLTALGKVRVQQASRRAVELLVEPDALPEPYRRVRTDADLGALAADLASDDAEARARAEAVARLAEASFYVRIY